MVHALEEAWRVLRREGILVDLRPIAVDTPLLILTRAGWQPAGMPDQKPDRIHDLACDRAVRRVVAEGLFARVKQRYFNIHYYWNSLEEVQKEMDERWKEDILVPDETWHRAQELLAQGEGQGRVRLPFRKKITLYRKIVV